MNPQPREPPPERRGQFLMSTHTRAHHADDRKYSHRRIWNTNEVRSFFIIGCIFANREVQSQ